MLKPIIIVSGIFTATFSTVVGQSSGTNYDYPEPEISTIMVRLDKLPMDAYDVERISDLLSSLARADTAGNREQLRNRAQLLALAMRLNRDNKQAEDLNEKYKEGKEIAGLDAIEKATCVKRLENAINYLSKAETGNEAHVLADYLKDVLKGLDAKNPTLADHKMDTDRWRNVVPELKKLAPEPSPDVEPEIAAQPDEKTVEESEMAENAESKEDSKENGKDDGTTIMAKWDVLESSVSAPVYYYIREDDKTRNVRKFSDFRIKITPVENEKNELNVSLTPGVQDKSDLKEIRKFLEKLISKQGLSYPSAKIAIKMSSEYSKVNGPLSHLPLGLQVTASLKDKQLYPGVTVMGRVNTGGVIYADSQFWDILKDLRKSKELEQILLCPLSTKRDFLQLIALEESDFFIRNEVIGVKTIGDALEYAADSNNSNFNKAHRLFLDLQKTVGTRSVGQFSSNARVRGTLNEILRLNPNHFSAQMVLERGDIKRAKKIESKYVALEVAAMMEVVSRVNRSDTSDLKSEYLSARSDTIREMVSQVKSFIDSEHDELISNVETLMLELNNMSRGRSKTKSDFHRRSAENAHKKFKETYAEIESQLNKLNKIDE